MVKSTAHAPMNATRRVKHWPATINVKNPINAFQVAFVLARRSSVPTANVLSERTVRAEYQRTTQRWSTVKAMFATRVRLTHVRRDVSWWKIRTVRCVTGHRGHHSLIAPMHAMVPRVAIEQTMDRTVRTNRLTKTKDRARRTVALSVTRQDPTVMWWSTMLVISSQRHAATNRMLERLRGKRNRNTSSVSFQDLPRDRFDRNPTHRWNTCQRPMESLVRVERMQSNM